MRAEWTWVLLLLASGVSAADDGGAVARALLLGGRYSLQSTVLANAAERRDRDLGYRIQAELDIAPVPDHAGPGTLLRLKLTGAELQVRGAHRSAEWQARGSAWDAERAPWYVLLQAGRVERLLLPPAQDPHVHNYKRALASLLQFADGAGSDERNETDASGACRVLYERAAGAVYRKIKRACERDALIALGQEGAGQDVLDARRVSRYTLGAGGVIGSVHAEEVLTLHRAVKLRSWHQLQRTGDVAGAPPPAASLQPATLQLEGEPALQDHTQEEEVSVALEQLAAALSAQEAGAGGRLEEARALLRHLPAVRRGARAELLRALEAAAPRALPALCRALGLAGSAAAARAAADFLRLGAGEPLRELAHDYLQGLALADAAEEAAVLHVITQVARERNPDITSAAFLSAAHAARGDSRTIVRDAITRSLQRCKHDECRALRLLALGNLAMDSVDMLLEAVERSESLVSSAALTALRRQPHVQSPHLTRLAKVVANVTRPLELRAAALDMVVSGRAASAVPAAPLQLLELALALHAEPGPAAHELRRLLWQRLHSLRAAPPVRALTQLLPPQLTSWDARAHAGTSHVLVRGTGWGGGAGGWGAALTSLQVAGGGVLRRGRVSLQAVPPSSPLPPPELEVEVWTTGLQTLAGAGAGAGQEEGPAEDTAAGLALTVAGAALPPVTLFNGQTELLSHVWAGTGSTPTRVVRAARVRRRARCVPLLGGVWAWLAEDAAASLALDAHAAVSLWSRAAHGALQLRAAVLARIAASLAAPWAAVRARREISLEPRLRIAFDLDFYDGVSLCVRAAVPPHAVRHHLRLASVAGDRKLNVTRGAHVAVQQPGRTLALGRDNDAACRTLHPADHDDDDDL